MPRKQSIPISKVCPRCGFDQSVQVSSSAILRYSTDRRCMRCQKTYAHPAPRWAGVVSLLAGGLMVGSCLAVVGWKLVRLFTQEHAEHVEASLYYGMTCMALMGGIGVFVLIHGLRLLRQTPVPPPNVEAGETRDPLDLPRG